MNICEYILETDMPKPENFGMFVDFLSSRNPRIVESEEIYEVELPILEFAWQKICSIYSTIEAAGMSGRYNLDFDVEYKMCGHWRTFCYNPYKKIRYYDLRIQGALYSNWISDENDPETFISKISAFITSSRKMDVQQFVEIFDEPPTVKSGYKGKILVFYPLRK